MRIAGREPPRVTLEASPNPVHEGKTPASLLLRSVVESPGTDKPEPSSVVARYDVNDNGAIDILEYFQALRR